MGHRLSRLRGFHIHATDGEIGHIDDFVLDEATWTIQYLIVDTSNFVGGKWVVLSPSVIQSVEWGKLRVNVSLSRDAIRSGPTLESLDVPAADKAPTHAFIF
jgi:sporulation protein YlmC with PRC-barrel domain